jgi:hypothetical protein
MNKTRNARSHLNPIDHEECAFRRGYVHGIAFAIDAVRAGASDEELCNWLEKCTRWREKAGRGEPSEFIAPRFKEAKDGTREGA